MIVGVLFIEIHMMYSALVGGDPPIELPPAGRYDDHCVRQYADTAALTLDSARVRRWVEFAANNDGTLPHFRCRSAIYRCPIPESCLPKR